MKHLVLIFLLLWGNQVIADKIHDPTRPKFLSSSVAPTGPEVAEINAGDIQLQGVLNRKDHKVAIISGQLYNKGDKVNGYLISDIKNDHVLLLSSGTRKRIYVYE